ncbi:MAG: hypothetical protein HOW71_24110 [Nonomuraea sp.]|nr:hypothetical protein [Nonomuraea sp.]
MTLPRDEGLTAEELAVWRMLQRAQVRIARRLEAELLVAHGLPLASYEVLARLAEATPTYLRGVKSQFLDLLGAGDVGEVRALLARLDVTDAC